jgi:hypothetical protein
MPCMDNGPRDDHEQCSKTIKSQRRRLNEVTRLLCYLCGELEEDKILAKYTNPQLSTWRERHHEKDTIRVKTKMLEAIQRRPSHTIISLCDKFIEEAEAVHPVSRFHKKWFLIMARSAMEEAQKIWKEKESKVQLKKKALEKLTKEERKALGLLKTK